MNRTWKWIIAIAVVMVVAAITVPAVYVIRFASTGRAVQAEIARIEAAGEPVSARDLAGEPVPDLQNAALVYEKCFKYLPKASSNSPDEKGLWDFLDPKKRSADPALWSRASTIVRRYGPALTLAEKAASMPTCRFKLDWTDPLSTVYYHLAFLRFLSCLAEARAILYARSGDARGATESIALIIQISDSLRDEPDAMDMLARCSIVRRASNALLDVAECTTISESDARLLYKRFRRVLMQDSALRALRGERAQGIIVFDQIRKGITPNMGDKETSATVQRAYGRFPFDLMLESDEAYFLDEMRARIGSAGLSYRVLDRKIDSGDSDAPRYALNSELLLSNDVAFAISRDQAIAALNGSRVFLGILAYHNHFGSYPASLDLLRTWLNWETQEDPFSGKPFIYRRQGRGFLLYSVADDLKDDGGLEPKDAKRGDIVWRLDK